VELLCVHDPQAVRTTLDSVPQDYFDFESVEVICEENGVYDVVLWSKHLRGDLQGVFEHLDDFTAVLTSALVASTTDKVDEGLESVAEQSLGELASMGRVAVDICRNQLLVSQHASSILPEDAWFRLLRSQLNVVHSLSKITLASSESLTSTSLDLTENSLLRRMLSLVQETFSSLVQKSSSSELSFSRLFKRLVEVTADDQDPRDPMYTEYRLILGGMLESYRAESDVLSITKRLVERDLFKSVKAYAAARRRGTRSHCL